MGASLGAGERRKGGRAGSAPCPGGSAVAGGIWGESLAECHLAHLPSACAHVYFFWTILKACQTEFCN